MSYESLALFSNFNIFEKGKQIHFLELFIKQMPMISSSYSLVVTLWPFFDWFKW